MVEKIHWEEGVHQGSRPAKSFPDFCTCFEISSRRCHTSHSSFIRIRSRRRILQPKKGNSNFSSCMASKLYKAFRFDTHTYIVSVLTPSDFRHGWAIFHPLVATNTRKGGLVGLPASGIFSEFFSTCSEICTWNLGISKQCIYIWQVARRTKFEFRRKQVTLTYFTSKNGSN